MKTKKFSISREDYIRYRVDLDNPTSVDHILRAFFNYVNPVGFELDLLNFRQIRSIVYQEGTTIKRVVIENGREVLIEWPIHGMDVQIDMENNLQDIVSCMDKAFEINFVTKIREQDGARVLLAIY